MPAWRADHLAGASGERLHATRLRFEPVTFNKLVLLVPRFTLHVPGALFELKVCVAAFAWNAVSLPPGEVSYPNNDSTLHWVF
ncbi:hypothetical protein BH10PLA2_BH10PLA2_33280 [soil metagenome]